MKAYLLLLLLPFLVSATNENTIERVGRHNIHVSYSRIAVEDDVAICNIRMFSHDLELAIKGHYGIDDFTLAPNKYSDSLYTRYFNEKFTFNVDGSDIDATVTGSGEDGEMWWFNMQFKAESKLTSASVLNELLFDAFDDQKNIVKLKHFPSEKNYSFYFVDGEDPSEVTF